MAGAAAAGIVAVSDGVGVSVSIVSLNFGM
jgi:hypothetical protein